MSTPRRVRALAWFFAAVLYYLLAQIVAASAARGLSSGEWYEFFNRGILLFLLISGFALMGFAGQRQRQPVRAMGLDPRPGWRREFGLGAALGWAAVVACVLPIALTGLVITFYTSAHQFALVVLDLLILAVAALVQEVAFRGYPFQRLIEATNPAIATLVLSVVYGLVQIGNPNASTAGILVAMLAGWLYSLAWLRTRALWVGWGFHFAWNASMAVLFGLPIAGIASFSPVIAANTFGPSWITGGDYGPEGSAIAVMVLLVFLILLGGIPVDLDAVARRQHEAAMGPAAPAAAQIVQITGIAEQPRESSPAENRDPEGS
jgi:membrane protease YdiL (CAAX protease family)